jgi:hypothetical protein
LSYPILRICGLGDSQRKLGAGFVLPYPMDLVKVVVVSEIMIPIIAQYNFKVNKPLCPTFLHDDSSRLVAVGILLPIICYVIYKILKYYNE